MESRLASLTLDMEEFEHAKGSVNSMGNGPQSGYSTVGTASIAGSVADDFFSVVAAMPVLFNMLFIRRAVIPAANGHFSARALARYYAVLGASADCDASVYTSSSKPPLGSHPQIPTLQPKDAKDVNTRCRRKGQKVDKEELSEESTNGDSSSHSAKKLFKDPKIHNAFLGTEEYDDLAQTAGPFGLGFRRYTLSEGTNNRYLAFGHSGIGGCTAFASPEHNFALAITINKMSRGSVTAKIVKFICAELNLPCPDQYAEHSMMGPDMNLGLKTPISESVSLELSSD